MYKLSYPDTTIFDMYNMNTPLASTEWMMTTKSHCPQRSRRQ